MSGLKASKTHVACASERPFLSAGPRVHFPEIDSLFGGDTEECGPVTSSVVKFAVDSLLEEAGFELVWGFSCQVVVLGFAESSLFGAGKPFFIPSPAIRFAERAEGVKGPKR